jgi:flagellar assembly protein FliH
MARHLQLETFDLPDIAERLPEGLQAEVEDLRLNAYEQGYAAGWDDALAAQNSEITRLRSDLGRNLVEMSLSYRDARRHVLGTLEPLLRDMVCKVLPTIAHATLGQIILEQLNPVAESLSSGPVIVKTSPANRDSVDALLTKQTGLPIRVVAEPTLGEGQAFVKLADTEEHVDLDGMITAIAEAVTAFFRTEKDEDN